RPGHLVVQQLGAFAQRRERRLELVGDVAQEAVFLRLELLKAPAQPVEAPAEMAQVLGTAHRDRAREVGTAELADRVVDRRDRARDVAGQRERDGQRDRGAEEKQQDEAALHLVGARAQVLHLAVDDEVVDRENFARRVDQLVDAPGDVGWLDPHARHPGEEIVERLLVAHGTVERAELRAVERQLPDLVGEAAEAAVHPRVALQELRVVEHRRLLRQALDRADALDEGAARARGLRGIEHGAAAFAGQTLGVPRRIRERAHEGKRHESETCEQQSEEGARVSHSTPNRYTRLDKLQCQVFTTDCCRSGTTLGRPRMRFAPTTVQWDGTSRVTTAFAPTVAPWPTQTAPRIFAPAPMHTSSSMTGAAGSEGCLLPIVTCCITV